MATYTLGEVVLLPFPFASGAQAKFRPALIMVDTGDADVLVARITGQRPRGKFDVELVDWKQANLALPSVVRVDKLASLERVLIQRSLGRLTPADWQKVRAAVRDLWGF